VVSEIDKAARRTCEAVKTRAQNHGVKCETIVHEGEEPYEHIVAEAEKHHADAIVIGRRGHRGLMKMLMGSVTHLVIGHAPCKVFVVPRTGQLAAKQILVATDGSRFSEKAASEAIKLAGLTKGSLVACGVVYGDIDENTAQDNVNRIKKLANAESINVETVISHGTAYNEIIEAAKAHNADMIVVGTHGRTGIKRLLMGSVTERVIGMSDSTVMIVG
jgi:nucleotide-binding universal stress UspA family protein